MSSLLIPALLLTGPVQAATWAQTSTGGGIDGNYSNPYARTFSMATDGLDLFAGTDGMNGCMVWKYSGSNWTRVNTDGFGDPNNMNATSMAFYGGDLFVGTENWATGCEVWEENGAA